MRERSPSQKPTTRDGLPCTFGATDASGRGVRRTDSADEGAKDRDVRRTDSADEGTKDKGKLRVGIYARVSTPDQDPGMQIDALREEAERRRWTVVDEYVDKGVSGTKARRPGLDRLMADARAHGFDVVAVWRFDRFARSTRHLLSALDEFRKLGIDFVSLTESIQTNSPLGEAIFTVIATISQLEHSLIQERVQAGVARARKRRASWGRPQRWTEEQVRVAFALRKAGKSWRMVAQTVHLPVRTIRRAMDAVAKRGQEQTTRNQEKAGGGA